MSFTTPTQAAPAQPSGIPPSDPRVYRLPRRVTSYDVGPDHRLTVPGLLRQLHDTAQSQAGHYGFGYRQLADLGLAWALVCIDLHFVGPTPRGETDFQVATSVRRAAGPVVMRDYTASVGREVFAIGQTMWALIDLDNRKTATPPAEMRTLLNDIATPTLDAPTARRLPDQGPFGKTLTREVYLHDCDFNGHLNNTVAVQWMLDGVVRGGASGAGGAISLTRLRASYHSEALLGEVLTVGVSDITPVEAEASGASQVALELRGPDGLVVANAVVKWA